MERDPFMMYVETMYQLGPDHWESGKDDVAHFDMPVPVPRVGDTIRNRDDVSCRVTEVDWSYGDNLVIVQVYSEPIPDDDTDIAP